GFAIELELRQRALALGARAGDFALRGLQILGRSDPRLGELADALQVLLRERKIVLRLARIRLRDAEVRRGKHRQGLPGLDAVAGAHGDRLHPPAERREYAHGAILV